MWNLPPSFFLSIPFLVKTSFLFHAAPQITFPSEAWGTASTSIWLNPSWCQTRLTMTQRGCTTTQWRYEQVTIWQWTRSQSPLGNNTGANEASFAYIVSVRSFSFYFSIISQWQWAPQRKEESFSFFNEKQWSEYLILNHFFSDKRCFCIFSGVFFWR